MKKIGWTILTFVLSLLAFQFWFKDWNLTWILVASMALHEIGHALVFWINGINVSITFVSFLDAAVKVEECFDNLTFLTQALVGLAGPAVNGILAIGGTAVLAMYPENIYVMGLVGINVSLLFFNLLPFIPFDGGKVTKAIFESADEDTDRLIASLVRSIALIGGLALVFLGKTSFTTYLSRGESPKNRNRTTRETPAALCL